MKWLTIDYIKQHSRLDYDDEISVIELYADSAEQAILNTLNRSYQDIIEHYGDVPAPIRHATLMLCDMSYERRNPVTGQSLSVVPYSIDILLKPYMRLTAEEDGNCCKRERTQFITIGSQTKILILAELPDELTLQDVSFTVTVYNDDQKDKAHKYGKADCILTDEGDYVVLVDTEEIGVGTVMVRLAVDIPDTDFPTGYRREIIRINPNMRITG